MTIPEHLTGEKDDSREVRGEGRGVELILSEKIIWACWPAFQNPYLISDQNLGFLNQYPISDVPYMYNHSPSSDQC